MHHTWLEAMSDRTIMVVETMQVGGVKTCMAVGEEETGADGVEVGIVVVGVVIDHINYQTILAKLWWIHTDFCEDCLPARESYSPRGVLKS
jgi:hypothetical protein